MVVCGEAKSISAAQRQVPECNPQLLLTSLRLGADDSLGFVKTLKSERPGLVVLVYSAFEESIFAERATGAGAGGLRDEKRSQRRAGSCHPRCREGRHLSQSGGGLEQV